MNTETNFVGMTIFTPTYNRAHTLERLYASLKKQASGWLEWLIVDDGSVDNTRELVDGFSAEGIVKIRYLYKQNGGKHTALNLGIEQAAGEYFFCVDSDDFLSDGAVETLRKVIEEKHPDGIIAYKEEWQKEGIIGDEFPGNLSQCSLFELINAYSCRGDRALIYKTEHIRKIRIPEPEGVSFFPETYLYDRFDEKHTMELVRSSLCVCEYLQDGYSNSFRMLMIRNAVSMKWFYAERIDMPCSLRVRFSSCFRYVAYWLLTLSPVGNYRGKRKFLLLLSVPAGLLMYVTYAYHRAKDKRGSKT